MFPGGSWKMDVVADGKTWERLGEMIHAERVALGMHTREDLAKATGFSTRFLADVEKGRRDNYDKESLQRIEQAIGWAAGSIKKVLDGGEPTRTQPRGELDPEDDDVEFEIMMIQQSDLPEKQKRDMIRYARHLQERQRADRLAFRERQRADRRAQLQALMDVARNTGGGEPDTQPAS